MYDTKRKQSNHGADYMSNKLVTIDSDTTAFEIANRMLQKRISAVIFMDCNCSALQCSPRLQIGSTLNPHICQDPQHGKKQGSAKAKYIKTGKRSGIPRAEIKEKVRGPAKKRKYSYPCNTAWGCHYWRCHSRTPRSWVGCIGIAVK